MNHKRINLMKNMMNMTNTTNTTKQLHSHTATKQATLSLVWFALSALLMTVVSVTLAGCGELSEPDKNASDQQSQSQVYAAPPLVPTELITVTVTIPVTVTVTIPVTMTTTAMVQGTATPATTATTGTPIGTPNYMTPMAATRIAYATDVATVREGLMTEVALTHAPTTTPGRPQEQPSPTPMLGLLPGCTNANTYGPQAVSCWRGVIDGELVDVAAGREGRGGDMQQGVVRIHVWGQQGADVVYQTPQRVGAVRIASVSGMLFTLETVNQPIPQTFVFNLATRQWASP